MDYIKHNVRHLIGCLIFLLVHLYFFPVTNALLQKVGGLLPNRKSIGSRKKFAHHCFGLIHLRLKYLKTFNTGLTIINSRTSYLNRQLITILRLIVVHGYIVHNKR